MANKVQTNEKGFNVLVQTDNSNNRHYYHGNFAVENLRKLSKKEIISAYLAQRSEESLLADAKNWISKQKGYCTSNVKDDVLGISYSDILKFKKLK